MLGTIILEGKPQSQNSNKKKEVIKLKMNMLKFILEIC